ncbi:hypothetical protein BDB01DRAFT_771552 [Pilobolus umbonatus]|nr:hypothetical protein BDB01DRAFT_771552 [Pilobolus umbonatus]
MVTLACIINSNAHGLGDSNSRNTDVALGIFPLAAMFFNHGCNPNAVFVGLPHGHLAIRTIRPVAKDEEIVLNYIDLYLSRDERRKELIESKHFWCKCKRCVAPIEKSVDRFLNGVICKQCTNDVYVIPPTPLDDILRGQSSLYLDDKAIYKCAICQHEIPCQFIREKLEEATIAYRNGVSAMRSKDYKRAQRIFENLLSKTDRGGEIHPLNSIRLNTYTSLMNCKMYYHDVKGAIDANKCILNMMREYASVGSLPDKTSEISDYLNNLGELCCDMANETKSRSMILEKKWKKEAITAYKEALDVRIIVYGKNHIKTKHIEDSIKALH